MIQSQSRVRGFYTVEKFKARRGAEIPGSRTTVAQFENLITDLGLNRLGEASPSAATTSCYVGSGSATPQVTDSDMNQFVAKHNVLGSDTRSAQSSVDPWYLAMRKTYRFNPLGSANNLSEVGVGWANSPSGALFSRALIRDADGNPSSITVLADEYLDVTYELRLYPDLRDFNGVVTIGGEAYNYLARASRANAAGASAWDFDRTATSGAYVFAHAGDIGDITANPSGNSGGGTGADISYSQGSFEGWSQLSWGLSNANFGGVRSVAANIGWGRWQVQFSRVSDGAAIPKDDTKILTLTLGHSWARG
ncbi:hypothetical protein ACJJID_00290 (plasmid) [Microbulbifer sp. CnH-101-G]|uniref:hypothetical protein n=1 Tax=Microbulbifer sp. CnH-101-G TaxID=3243393 RepID=UPI00403945E5